MAANGWKILFYLIVIIGILTLGFYFGRKTINNPEIETEIQYLPGKTIIDTHFIDKPYKVIVPIDTLGIIQQCIKDGIYKELWPEKVVTKYIEVDKTDTNTILKDWAIKRYYEETLFHDNVNGLCVVNAEVQYNRLSFINYEYNPVKQVITETKYDVKAFSPFIGFTYLTNPWDEIRNPMIQINGGFFLKEKYAFHAVYQRGLILKNDYVGGGIIYKF